MKIKFQDFLFKFPEVELPVTLSEDTVSIFSQQNDPLPSVMAQKFINVFEDQDMDDLTEYVPCLKIPKTDGFHAVVYWKAELLNYQYVMITFDKAGNFIDSRTLAGTTSDGDIVVKSVATIEDDWMIYVVSGAAGVEADMYDAATSRTTDMELLPDGKII